MGRIWAFFGTSSDLFWTDCELIRDLVWTGFGLGLKERSCGQCAGQASWGAVGYEDAWAWKEAYSMTDGRWRSV
jgi:hypothetical protein